MGCRLQIPAQRWSKAPESRREKLKNSILAVLGRSNHLDTASQVIDVPVAQLEELREEARKASRWNFLLGLLHLPWSIIQGEDYLIFQGIGFLVLGWYIKRLAQDDAKLLAWEERTSLAWSAPFVRQKRNMVAMAAQLASASPACLCKWQWRDFKGNALCLIHGLEQGVSHQYIDSGMLPIGFPFVAKHL